MPYGDSPQKRGGRLDIRISGRSQLKTGSTDHTCRSGTDSNSRE
jgi:hypothetical protein